MGQGKERDADGFFQNAMTHVYFRQSDIESMRRIEKEVGLKDIAKTSVSITEGGQQSKVSYTAGDFVHDRMAVSETKSVHVEEKPYFETEQIKQLPDFVAIVIPSTGNTVLPATIGFMRPCFVYDDHPDLPRETGWHDWPKTLKHRETLYNVPQSFAWEGWGEGAEEAEDSDTLGRERDKAREPGRARGGNTEETEHGHEPPPFGEAQSTEEARARAEQIRQASGRGRSKFIRREAKAAVPSGSRAGENHNGATQPLL